jgi:hypothetical protein
LGSLRNSIEGDVSLQTSFSGFGDVLDEIIEEAKRLKDLPLDSDEDEDGDTPSCEADGPDDSGGSDMERSSIRAPKAKRKYKKEWSIKRTSLA